MIIGVVWYNEKKHKAKPAVVPVAKLKLKLNL
jgi:hypothetical protein